MDIVLPFGKHRGVSLGEIPTHYLLWVHFECDFQAACGLSPYQWVIPHVRLELIRRLGNSGVETLQAAYQRQVLPLVLPVTQAERWADGLACLRKTSLKAFRPTIHDSSPSDVPQ